MDIQDVLWALKRLPVPSQLTEEQDFEANMRLLKKLEQLLKMLPAGGGVDDTSPDPILDQFSAPKTEGVFDDIYFSGHCEETNIGNIVKVCISASDPKMTRLYQELVSKLGEPVICYPHPAVPSVSFVVWERSRLLEIFPEE
ncbi:MAG: hypothetical protein HY007_01075 [Candidatus Sungbacteria bacterium]|nr:hypothetical protein [Candidatus Sungbacteria bacterium]